MENHSKFEAVDYLDNEEVIAEYLTAALEDENPDVFLAAIADVAKARASVPLPKAPDWAEKAFTKHSLLAQNHVMTLF
jgi:DNA-binding phage protein